MRALGLSGADLADLSAEVLSQGGSFSLRAHAHGSCMVPFIRDGDLLSVEPADAAALRVGDVVFSRAGERLVAHRVVARRVGGGEVVLTTRGDAAMGPGERVEAGQVLGRVVQAQRGGRTLVLDRGAWRLAGRLWVATVPLGPGLLGGGRKLKGLGAWLCLRANVEPRVGGAYELFWNPDESRPDHDSTIGCRVLSIDRPRLLAFSWRGSDEVADVMNVEGAPQTSVTVQLLPRPSGTRLVVVHEGWGEGDGWARARAWFDRAWSGALERLRASV